MPNCFNDHFALECLFISLVRSRSEHASITWDPHSFSISNEIELAVRDKRLRFICFKMKTVRLPYSGHRNSLNFLNLKSLSVRRKDSYVNYFKKLSCNETGDTRILSFVDFKTNNFTTSEINLFFIFSMSPVDYMLFSPVNTLLLN